MAIEQDDPCQRARQLREVRDKLVTGQQVAEYEFESGNGQRRRTKFSAANLIALDKEISKAEAACAAQSGGRPRRFAILPR